LHKKKSFFVFFARAVKNLRKGDMSRMIGNDTFFYS